jgi:sporulation protein YlmC with PRC-barrel domain
MAKDRIRSDLAGVGPDPSYAGELVRLHDLKGFKVASGEPDIRGWDVCTLSGADVGEVDDLLVDPRRGEVVMIEVDLKGTGRHAEVPLRAVQLDRSRKVVVVDTGDVSGYTTDGVRGRLTDDDRDRLNQTYGLTDHDLRYDLREDSRVDINDRDLTDRDRSIAERERALAERERELDERERKLSDRGTVQETVVDRKPVVVEETIVRRRRLDPDDPEARDLDTSRDV